MWRIGSFGVGRMSWQHKAVGIKGLFGSLSEKRDYIKDTHGLNKRCCCKACSYAARQVVDASAFWRPQQALAWHSTDKMHSRKPST